MNWLPSLAGVLALPRFLFSTSTTAVSGSDSTQALQAISRLRTGVECVICRSDTGEVEFSESTPSSGCDHAALVCIGCLQQVILTAIASGHFLSGIICPYMECSQRLDYYDVQRWTAPDVFDRYDKLLLVHSLRADEHYVLCLQPTCGSGQEVVGGEQNNIVTCHNCGTKQCFRHQILWHEGYTCEQWDEHEQEMRNQGEELSDAWIQTETKPCPGPRCGRRIEKMDGCDHLVCRPPGGCGHQFCWQCMAPWREIIAGDNSRHYDGCRYYTGRPGGNPAPRQILATVIPARRLARATLHHRTPQVFVPAPPPAPVQLTTRRLPDTALDELVTGYRRPIMVPKIEETHIGGPPPRLQATVITDIDLPATFAATLQSGSTGSTASPAQVPAVHPASRADSSRQAAGLGREPQIRRNLAEGIHRANSRNAPTVTAPTTRPNVQSITTGIADPTRATSPSVPAYIPPHLRRASQSTVENMHASRTDLEAFIQLPRRPGGYTQPPASHVPYSGSVMVGNMPTHRQGVASTQSPLPARRSVYIPPHLRNSTPQQSPLFFSRGNAASWYGDAAVNAEAQGRSIDSRW